MTTVFVAGEKSAKTVTHSYTFNMKTTVEQDVWQWITGYVEVNHKFYDYKFPPCPYARSARLKGLVDVQAYTSGSALKFIQQQVSDLLLDRKFNVRVLVFPAWLRWLKPLHWAINRLNKQLIGDDYYMQYGRAVNTASQYPELLKGSPYFIVIINYWPDVVRGVESLSKTAYYTHWPKDHFDAIVTRRQRALDQYTTRTNNEVA